MKFLELLAPARDAQTAIDAINHGADAVYMGASKFGAREQAGNSFHEIESVVKYAHLFGVKVYATVNTLFFDHESKQVEQLLLGLWNIGVDALIIQDPGILEMNLPPMRFHISTQANNRSLSQIQFWEKTGASRVILARELSLNEIREIGKNSQIELEAFIHGALCVSYSGNCYMSYDINGRSANRGNCAQPCRLPYDLVDSAGKLLRKNQHLISLSDLNATPVLEEMILAGVTSFKIEGRLKDSLYVKNITAHYHQLLNRFVASNPGFSRSSTGKCEINFIADPSRTFSRGSTTYFYNNRPQNLANLVSPKSMGKFLGKVEKTGQDYFSLDTPETLANGDGICFENEGNLLGTQIIGSTNLGFKPQSMAGIKSGIEIFRNRDHSFNKQVENSNTPRKLNAKISVFGTFPILNLEVETNLDKDSIQIQFVEEAAQNLSRAIEIWKTQLAKTGDSSFFVTDVEIHANTLPHLPMSRINEIRRLLIEQLMGKILERHLQNRSISNITSVPYFSDKLTYQNNVANTLSNQFFKNRGVKTIEPAFEIVKPNQEKYTVMTTRYCILFELGYCKKLKKTDTIFSEPLFLLHQNRRYQLRFDCAECQMIVESTKIQG